MTDWTLADIRAYYETHADLVAPHLFDRLVRCYPPSTDDATVSTVAGFLDRVAMGVGGFSVRPHRLDAPADSVDRLVVRLTTGDGADIATAAMAAQAIAESLAADGNQVVAMTDGADGFLLIAPVPSRSADQARAYVNGLAAALAGRAPEIATVNRVQSAGRVFVDTSGTHPAAFSPVPYSLIPHESAQDSTPGVIMPVTMDEVSAASAGMPLDPEPGDVVDRLAMWSDLSSALHS